MSKTNLETATFYQTDLIVQMETVKSGDFLRESHHVSDDIIKSHLKLLPANITSIRILQAPKYNI